MSTEAPRTRARALSDLMHQLTRPDVNYREVKFHDKGIVLHHYSGGTPDRESNMVSFTDCKIHVRNLDEWESFLQKYSEATYLSFTNTHISISGNEMDEAHFIHFVDLVKKHLPGLKEIHIPGWKCCTGKGLLHLLNSFEDLRIVTLSMEDPIPVEEGDLNGVILKAPYKLQKLYVSGHPMGHWLLAEIVMRSPDLIELDMTNRGDDLSYFYQTLGSNRPHNLRIVEGLQASSSSSSS